MARWFPDRRGFAIGIVAAGYGMGAMLTTFPISSMLSSLGALATLIVFGVILGSVGVLAALGLREPRAGEAAFEVGDGSALADLVEIRFAELAIGQTFGEHVISGDEDFVSDGEAPRARRRGGP